MAIAKCTFARALSHWGGELRAATTLRQPGWLLWEKPCSFLLLHLSSLPAFFFSDFSPIDRCDPTLGAGKRKELSTQNFPLFNSERACWVYLVPKSKFLFWWLHLTVTPSTATNRRGSASVRQFSDGIIWIFSFINIYPHHWSQTQPSLGKGVVHMSQGFLAAVEAPWRPEVPFSPEIVLLDSQYCWTKCPSANLHHNF